MTAVIKVEIDGQVLDLSECVWIETAPCGCVSAVSLAEYVPLDLDAAWTDLTGNPRDADSRKAEGFTFELRPRSDVPKPWNDCPHDPKWGRP